MEGLYMGIGFVVAVIIVVFAVDFWNQRKNNNKPVEEKTKKPIDKPLVPKPTVVGPGKPYPAAMPYQMAEKKS